MSGRLNTRVSVAKTVSKSDSVYRSLTQSTAGAATQFVQNAPYSCNIDGQDRSDEALARPVSRRMAQPAVLARHERSMRPRVEPVWGRRRATSTKCSDRADLMSDRAGRGLQVARENRRHSGAYVEDFRGRAAGREQARRRQIRSVRTLSAWCTTERSRYLLTDKPELITPAAWTTWSPWSETLEPRVRATPGSELVTPEDWLR